MTRKSKPRSTKSAVAKAGALVATQATASRFGIAAPAGLVSHGLRFARRNPVLALAATAVAGYVALRRRSDTNPAEAGDSSVMAELNEDAGNVRS
ncbi:hypothetical protein [Antarctobacter sp.]|uniref:hypothetical protein n=1 Tax=Antarctobacter sp. TaxID=1872577 RepID=UPI002B276751|nr:hypothetical protein [Antarctobacter sp.]